MESQKPQKYRLRDSERLLLRKGEVNIIMNMLIE